MEFTQFLSLLDNFLSESYEEELYKSLEGGNFLDLDSRSYYRGRADMCLKLRGWLIGADLMIYCYKDKELSDSFKKYVLNMSDIKELD